MLPINPLEATLTHIESQIEPYTQIVLLKFTPQEVNFKIRWHVRRKKKNYKVSFPRQRQTWRRIGAFLLKFSTRKLELNDQTELIMSSAQPQCKSPQITQIKDIMQGIPFSQLQIQDQDQLQNFYHLISSFKMQKISILPKIGYNQLYKCMLLLLQNAPSVSLDVQIGEVCHKSLLQTIDLWKSALQIREKDKLNIARISSMEMSARYHLQHSIIPAVPPIYPSSIVIYHNKHPLISLACTPQFGYSLHFYSKIALTLPFCLSLLSMILLEHLFISIEIQSALGFTVELLQELFRINEKRAQQKQSIICPYLIKIGHQIEVTPSRMLLNTTDLPAADVIRILDLLRQPGHYEFILYSNLLYFYEVLALFITKPFVRFNYFIPLEESQEKEGKIISCMQKCTSSIRKIVIGCLGMMKERGQITQSVLQLLELQIE